MNVLKKNFLLTQIRIQTIFLNFVFLLSRRFSTYNERLLQVEEPNLKIKNLENKNPNLFYFPNPYKSKS